MMIDIQKLVAVMAIQYIGSTRFNQFILLDKEGNKLDLERFDYPNGDYAVYDMTNKEEMVRVKFPANDPTNTFQVITNSNAIMSVFILASELTYEISLEYNDNDQLCTGIIDTTPFDGHEIKVHNATASYYSIEYAAETAPRPVGMKIK